MKSTRFATLFAALGLVAFLSSASWSQTVSTNGSDNAGNYSGGWNSGANGGTGFGAWIVSANSSSNYYAGAFIGNPTNAEITSFGTQAFGLYANPGGTAATVSVDRSLSNALSVGQTLEFKWAVNWDAGGGNKGFNLYAGGPGTNQILNVNQAGFPGNITFNGANAITNHGSGPMTWRFTLINSNTLRVTSSPRDGSTTIAYSNNLSVSGAPQSFRFYATAMDAGDQRQPYFNDFLITTTTADVTPPVIGLAPGVDKVTWVATGTSVTLANTDVTASDAITTSPTVTFLPATVDTTVDGLTAVTYTATDAAGNAATVTRVIAVGAAAPGYHNLRFPAALTVNTNSTESAYGEIFIDGATPGAGAASGVQAWIGVNSANSDPSTWDGSAWSAASYVGEEGNNDNYQGAIAGTNRAPGTYYFATRFQLGTNSSNTNFFYGGIGTDGVGGTWGGTRQVVVGGVTNTVTNGNGVLSVVPVRSVTFAVDMGVQIFKGLFNPATNGVEVRGDFNNTAFNTGFPLFRQGTSTIYTNTLAINGTNEAVLNYKFFGNGTNELAWENRGNRSLSLASSNQTVPTAFFSDLSEARKITFRVDMTKQIEKGNFNPASNSVSVIGSFNTFNPTANVMAPAPGAGPNVYTATVFLDGPQSGNIEYKFFNNSVGAPNGGYEIARENANRTFAASGLGENLTETTVSAIPLFSNDDGVGPTLSLNGSATVTLTVGDSYTDAGATATDLLDGDCTVEVTGGPVSTAVPGSYTLTYTAFDVAGNASVPASVQRTVTVQAAEGSTFAGWAGSGTATNSELVGKYAIGGATNISAASEKPVAAVDSNTLSLSAIVRTNDTKLTVVGEAGGSLTNWSTNGVSMTPSANTSGVPDGHQRQVFSVDRANSPTRQFLRLKATLEP